MGNQTFFRKNIFLLFVLVAFPLQTLFAQQFLEPDYWNTATVADVKQKIANGENVNARTKDGWTPLHAAAAVNKNAEVLKTLINAGANLEARAKTGETFLDLMEQNEALKGSQLYWELRDAQYNQ